MHMLINTVMSYTCLKFSSIFFKKKDAYHIFGWFTLVSVLFLTVKSIRNFYTFCLCVGVTEYTCEDNVNPCGDDAYCNQTKTSLLCQCKPGFQRNEMNRQCEGTNLFYHLSPQTIKSQTGSQFSVLEKEMCITCIFFLKNILFHSCGIWKLR